MAKKVRRIPAPRLIADNTIVNDEASPSAQVVLNRSPTALSTFLTTETTLNISPIDTACFFAGTTIACPDRERAVETLSIGDLADFGWPCNAGALDRAQLPIRCGCCQSALWRVRWRITCQNAICSSHPSMQYWSMTFSSRREPW
jgi:hypothetical protein